MKIKAEYIVGEEWREVDGFKGRYRVSNFGRIISRRTGFKYIMQYQITKKGYYLVGLYMDDIKYYKSVHRLVALAFIDNPDSKPQVNHIDGNKLNNNASNLEWVTSSENRVHGIKNNLIVPVNGVKHGNCILNEDQVRFIKNSTLSGSVLGKQMGVSAATIWKIKSNRGWKHLFKNEKNEN